MTIPSDSPGQRCPILSLPIVIGSQAQEAVAMAKKDPSTFVMKAQREGGFFNFYDEGQASCRARRIVWLFWLRWVCAA